jgi:putative membrane protein
MDSGAEQDPRVYFAAERTFLAWIRTGLGLIGIGFAVSRFSLFLREISGSQAHAATHATGLSLWSGILLVLLGVVVILSSLVRHVQLVRALKTGTWMPGQVSRQGIALGLILATAGIGMCFYLVVVR